VIRRAVIACVAALLCTGCGDGSSNDSPNDPSVPVTQGFPLYGPRAHWIDRVRSGTVTFEAVAVVAVDLNRDGSGDLTLEVRGPTTVFRSAARATDPSNPGHRKHLDLEIVSMTLSAEDIEFRAGDGAGNFAADGPLFSIGASDEIGDDPRLAHDDFAIYFEGTVAGLSVHNEAPLRMVAHIDRLPPIGNLFTMSGPPLPLFTEDGHNAGLQITSVNYTPLDPNDE